MWWRRAYRSKTKGQVAKRRRRMRMRRKRRKRRRRRRKRRMGRKWRRPFLCIFGLKGELWLGHTEVGEVGMEMKAKMKGKTHRATSLRWWGEVR